MAKKYIARLDGTIVGTRTTKDRTYTHAVVVQLSEDWARDKAYNYVPNDTDRSNFEYYVKIAEGRSSFAQTTENVLKASALIDGGFDAYVERIREAAIARFEAEVKRGKYEPEAVTWCSRLDLAHKQRAGLAGAWVKEIWIVPAEEVTKKAKT